MAEDLTYNNVEWLRDYFQPKIETGTVLPHSGDIVDGTEFILVDGATRTPHKMINGKWHTMTDGTNTITYTEV